VIVDAQHKPPPCSQSAMAYLTRFLWRFLYYCILCFVSVSVVYTTTVLFFSPLMSLAPKVNFSSPPRSALSSRFFVAGIKRSIFEPRSQVSNGGNKIVSKPVFPLISQDSTDSVDVAPIAPLFNWVSSKFTLQHGLGHSEPITVDARTVVSKAFSNSMRPSNVFPYFYRASGSFNRDDITVTTLITSNRFEVFARLVEKYRGLPGVPFFFRLLPITEILPQVQSRLLSTLQMSACICKPGWTLCMTCTRLRI
jgi:hypothetical protein